MMPTGVFSTSSGYLRWRSRSERFALPYITMNGTSSQWAAGNLQLAHDIAATNSCGTGARASSRFAGHFTPAKAVLPVRPRWLMSRLVFPLRLIRFSMSSASSSHAQTPNQSMRFLIKIKVYSSAGPIRIGHFCRLGLEGGTSLGQSAGWRLVRQARIGRFCYDVVAFLQAGSWDSFAGP